MSLFNKDLPPADVSDEQKLAHVYEYVVRKEKEDAAVVIWKWLWRGVVLLSIYLVYVQAMGMISGKGSGLDLGSLMKSLNGTSGVSAISGDTN